VIASIGGAGARSALNICSICIPDGRHPGVIASFDGAVVRFALSILSHYHSRRPVAAGVHRSQLFGNSVSQLALAAGAALLS
jgi:hypothetical protein